MVYWQSLISCWKLIKACIQQELIFALNPIPYCRNFEMTQTCLQFGARWGTSEEPPVALSYSFSEQCAINVLGNNAQSVFQPPGSSC